MATRYYEIEYHFQDEQEPERQWKAKRSRKVKDSESLRLILEGLKANPPTVILDAAPAGHTLVDVRAGSSSVRPFAPSPRGGFTVLDN